MACETIRTFFNVFSAFFKIQKNDYVFLSCCTSFLKHWYRINSVDGADAAIVNKTIACTSTNSEVLSKASLRPVTSSHSSCFWRRACKVAERRKEEGRQRGDGMQCGVNEDGWQLGVDVAHSRHAICEGGIATTRRGSPTLVALLPVVVCPARPGPFVSIWPPPVVDV